MAPRPAGREAGSGGGLQHYERHRPEHTLLYKLVEERYPVFAEQMAAQGTPLPRYVQREFEDYPACGRLEHGFLRVRCDGCRAEQLVAFSCRRRGFCPSCGARRMAECAALLVDEVLPHEPMRQWVLSFPYPLRFLFASRPAVMSRVLGIVYRTLATHLIRKAGFKVNTAHTGAVTLIQCFGGAINLNVHLHMLFLDGVYVERPDGSLRFRWVKAPTSAELTALAHTIARRVGRYLERRGLIERDAENTYLSLDGVDEDPMHQLLGDSITYRISVGPRQGRKVFILQTLPPCEPEDRLGGTLGKVAGFSLHAGVATRGHDRHDRGKLERLCRYIARPAVSERRLSLTPSGKVRYQLKTPYRDGTTHVIFEPVDFIAKLAALVPKPRVNLTRYHGVFAPNSRQRAQVTPAKRGKGNMPQVTEPAPKRPAAKRRAAMTWAQRLRRVLNIDVANSAGQPIGTAAGCREAVGYREVPDETCRACGGALRVIACIDDPVVIEKILSHLNKKTSFVDTNRLPESRAPPQRGFFD